MTGCCNTWRDSEVDALLDVWSNDAIEHQLSRSYRNDAVHRKIKAELAKRGVVREWKQCSDKVKALKKKYKEVVDGLHQSGVSVESDDDAIETDWRFFGVLHGVLGGRPAVSPTYLLEIGRTKSPTVSEPGPGSEEASLLEDVDQQQQTKQPTQMEQQQQLQSQSADNQIPAGVQTAPERQGEDEALTVERVSQPQWGEAQPNEEVPCPSRPKKRKVTKVDKAQKDISTALDKLMK